ncbi:MAG: hypothetical protein ACRD4Y_01880, partial [Candidatus Acidiferrales bacterium]
AVNRLIRVAEKNNLRLRVSYAPGPGSGNQKIPRFISEIQGILTRSRLKSSQWTLQASLPGESGTAPSLETPATAAGTPGKGSGTNGLVQPLCEMNAFQDF